MVKTFDNVIESLLDFWQCQLIGIVQNIHVHVGLWPSSEDLNAHENFGHLLNPSNKLMY